MYSKLADACLVLQNVPSPSSGVRLRRMGPTKFRYALIENIENDVIGILSAVLSAKKIPDDIAFGLSARFYKDNKHIFNDLPREDDNFFSFIDVQRLVYERAQTFLYEIVNTESPLPEVKKGIAYFTALDRNRKEQQDRVCAFTNLGAVKPDVGKDLEGVRLFAVFDGHGSTLVAQMAVSNFAPILIDVKEDNPDLTDQMLLKESLGRLSDTIDKQYKPNHLVGGSTATVLMLNDDIYSYCWLGDSPLLMFTATGVTQLNAPHNLENESEKERVKDHVINVFGVDRVNASLLLTRAIGDVDERPAITTDAETGVVDLSQHPLALIVASDGLTEHANCEDIYGAIIDYYSHHADHADSGQTIAQHLIEYAIVESCDNISVVFVELKPREEILIELVDITAKKREEPIVRV